MARKCAPHIQFGAVRFVLENCMWIPCSCVSLAHPSRMLSLLACGDLLHSWVWNLLLRQVGSPELFREACAPTHTHAHTLPFAALMPFSRCFHPASMKKRWKLVFKATQIVSLSLSLSLSLLYLCVLGMFVMWRLNCHAAYYCVEKRLSLDTILSQLIPILVCCKYCHFIYTEVCLRVPSSVL
jgi:hypothetical protein